MVFQFLAWYEFSIFDFINLANNLLNKCIFQSYFSNLIFIVSYFSIYAQPIYGDQLAHAKLIKSQGWAIILDFDILTENILKVNIMEILSNQTYKSNAMKNSQLFRDRPMTPLQTAIYWIEYVIRYDGARHLQSSAVHLNFFQKNSLDIFLLFAILFYIILKLVMIIISFMLKHRALLILSISIILYILLPSAKSE